MITRSAVDEEFLAEVVTRITDVVRPWRIILFGSRARGGATDDSDYDFYVEIDATGDDALDAAHDRIRDALDDGDPPPSVDVKVQSRGSLEDRRDDPGTIEWDVAREGRLLYADPDAGTTLVPPDRVREPFPGEPDSSRDWLEVASRDVRHRDYLRKLPEDWSPEIGWLSQQAAEKYLKALLVSRRLRPPRTHNLSELLTVVERSRGLLSGLRADCKLLTKHAIAPRYTVGHLRPTHARAAIAACDRIVAAVLSQLPGTTGARD